MRKILFILPLLFVLTSADVEVSDIEYKDRMSFLGKDYVLNGAGIRENFFLDIYKIGLYLDSKNSKHKAILNSEQDKFVRIVVVSSLVTADRFANGMDDGFKKSTGSNTKPIEKEIQQLKKGFGTDFNVGDEFVVFFGADGETKIYKENNLKITIPVNKTFQKALLGMWIGDNPVVGDLKEELLGID